MQVIGDNAVGAESSGMSDDLAQNILNRLDALEESNATNTNSNAGLITSDADIVLMKQQVDALKQFVNKSLKTAAAKSDLTMLKNEMAALKKALHSTEQIAIENNAQLMILNMKMDTDEAEAVAEEVAVAEDEAVDEAEAEDEAEDEAGDIDESTNYSNTTPVYNAVIVEDEPDESDDNDE